MTMHATMFLGFLMAAIAVVNATLMAWLWRFPMRPDPTGRDPNGISTAPRAGTNTHRVLGYVFVLAYAALLVEMVPRVWEFRVGSAASVLHGALGILVGAILVVKIAVIRRFRRFGNRLPWIGGALATTTVIVAALGIIPAWKVIRPLTPVTAELRAGREIVSRKCNQCHGPSIIAAEREDARKWTRITREMQRFSRTSPGKEPISEDERIVAAAYLVHTLGEVDEHERDDEEGNEEEAAPDAREQDDDRETRGRGRGGRRGGR